MPAPAAPLGAMPVQLPASLAGGTRPLAGLTLLVVEDSRFTCDALRLLCQRSGARLRRADSLARARAHLRLYRPDLILVDLGLPDGRGEDLLAELATRTVRPVLLGLSGDSGAAPRALAAGADGFVEKPLPGLAGFQRLLLGHLGGHGPPLADSEDEALAPPDPLALHEDLRHAAALIGRRDPAFVAGFVQGIARIAQDHPLEEAARDLLQRGSGAAERLGALLDRRLAPGSAPLIAPPDAPPCPLTAPDRCPPAPARSDRPAVPAAAPRR